MELKTTTDKLIADVWMLEIKLNNLRGALDTPEARAKLESEIQEAKHKLELAKSGSQKDSQNDPVNTTAPDMTNNTGNLTENPQQDVNTSEAKKRTLSEHIEPSQDSEIPAAKSRRILTSSVSAAESALLTPADSEVLTEATSDAKPESTQPPQLLSLDNSSRQALSPISIRSDSASVDNGTKPAPINDDDDFMDIDDDGSPAIVDKNHITNLFSDIQESNSEEDEKKLAEALKYPLYRHQEEAVKWMKVKELDDHKCGGILGDDMGLGKTLSMIALMLSRQAKHSSGVKTNLIVAPVSLLKQWQREIEDKILPEYRLRVFTQHTKKTDYSHLSTYDVVLTSYGMLASELGRLEKYIQQCTDGAVAVDNGQLSQMCPFLGPDNMFLRVILDEAQNIKNHKSKSAKAVFKLKSKYRWCLTGTPMQNGAKELASLFRFLNIQPYCDLGMFKRTFGCLDKNMSQYHKNRALKQLQAILNVIVLRRTKDSTIDGQPIIKLNPKIEIVDHAYFDAEENEFYLNLQKDNRSEFKGYVVAGTVGKNYARILVMLLRQRQACCHPLLVSTDLEFIDENTPEDSLVDAAKSLLPNLVERIKEADAFECSSCGDGVANPAIMCPCGDYFCQACIQAWLDNVAQDVIRADGNRGEVKCPTCGKSTDSKFTSYTVFKAVHMPETVKDVKDDTDKKEDAYGDISDTDDDSSEYSSDEDSNDIDEKGNLKGFVVPDDVEDWVDKPKSKKKVKQHKTKSEAKIKKFHPDMLKDLRKKASYNRRAHKRYMSYLRMIAMPSAKVTLCCDIISNIQKTTGEKIIVFSQWTLLLDILELSIKDRLKMRVCRYDGSMSAAKRDSAASEFTESEKVKVILVSLKAGNAGLNLTAASQVIIMDPFWNPYVENQAIDRAHRIGQKREVTVHRILVQETIEDRIVQIQEQKRNIVEAALDQAARKKLGKLRSDEFAYLFGFGGRSAGSK
ncbi:SNF2 family N-terminal domain-containing protein [Hypoxylon sp. FL1857]|nr:SNF2 family N-terminal domain-containing protein [Hypoxylon sp. FL1857]